MRLWHSGKARELAEPLHSLSGNLGVIRGDRSDLSGQASVSGDVSELKGCLTGLRGSCDGLSGEVTGLRGDISGIIGHLSNRLFGDVSGLRGDVSGVWGNATGLRGEVVELLDKGLLWPNDRPLSLGMFATRYNLAMEFFDSSGLPALIAFHAIQGAPLHWLTVRANTTDGFVVGPLAEIQKRFPGQEIAKVAVPSEANWQISEDIQLIRTDRVYALEHIAPLVSTFRN